MMRKLSSDIQPFAKRRKVKMESISEDISLPKISYSKIGKRNKSKARPGDVPIEVGVDCLAPAVPTFMY